MIQKQMQSNINKIRKFREKLESENRSQDRKSQGSRARVFSP